MGGAEGLLPEPDPLAVIATECELLPVPPGPVTLIVPLVVPEATMAVIFVFETTLKLWAFVPWNLTAVVPVKPEPLIVTTVPDEPSDGLKLEIPRLVTFAEQMTSAPPPLAEPLHWVKV